MGRPHGGEERGGGDDVEVARRHPSSTSLSHPSISPAPLFSLLQLTLVLAAGKKRDPSVLVKEGRVPLRHLCAEDFPFPLAQSSLSPLLDDLGT